MIVIGIDISPTSTAVFINGTTQHLLNYSTQKPNNKYIKLLENFVQFYFIEYNKTEKYSEKEILKAKVYYDISNQITNSLQSMLPNNADLHFVIEGHSYSSQAGHIIDVATITGMIKSNLFRFFPSATLHLISPISLKLMVAELVYGCTIIEVGRRVIRQEKRINTNHLNTPPNKYQKTDMIMALHDYKCNIPAIFDQFMIENYGMLSKLKSLPKPIDDLVDAFWLSETFKKLNSIDIKN